MWILWIMAGLGLLLLILGVLWKRQQRSNDQVLNSLKANRGSSRTFSVVENAAFRAPDTDDQRMVYAVPVESSGSITGAGMPRILQNVVYATAVGNENGPPRILENATYSTGGGAITHTKNPMYQKPSAITHTRNSMYQKQLHAGDNVVCDTVEQGAIYSIPVEGGGAADNAYAQLYARTGPACDSLAGDQNCYLIIHGAAGVHGGAQTQHHDAAGVTEFHDAVGVYEEGNHTPGFSDGSAVVNRAHDDGHVEDDDDDEALGYVSVGGPPDHPGQPEYATADPGPLDGAYVAVQHGGLGRRASVKLHGTDSSVKEA